MLLDFDYFYRWAIKELNLDLHSYKQKQLQRRITTVMKSSGATNLQEYANLIEADEGIKKAFLDYITINVSEFFRNKEIFDGFESILVNRLVKRFKSLKIWSAACSIGAEPYSLAIILDKNNMALRHNIIASDIDDKILERARQGIYKEHEIKNVSQEILNKYFIHRKREYYLDGKIKRMVDFRKHDLIVDDYEKGFHAIICRNVVIYFKKETKDKIYRKMGDSLVSGGVLFTGATESIYSPESYGLRKISTFIYEKI